MPDLPLPEAAPEDLRALAAAGVLYADEAPARVGGRLHHAHVACAEFLTAMHAGGRSAEDIDAGQALPGHRGAIVRDGYAGHQHLAGALHAWCGAHGPRDLRGVYEADPDGQVRARSVADLLISANAQAAAARAVGQARLSDARPAGITAWHRGAVAKGITGNQGRRTRPVKVQMRTSGGCWRTLQGLADFAIVQSHLSTAAKWGIGQLDALTQLFTDGPRLPAAIRHG